jgi:hypothetical protein
VAAESGKLAGKTEWAGRRRPATRRAGFSATSPVQLAHEVLDGYQLRPGDKLIYVFTLPSADTGEWAGFGGWFSAGPGIEVRLEFAGPHVLTSYAPPSWNKVGTLLEGPMEEAFATLIFTATSQDLVTTYSMLAGGVKHDYLAGAKPALRRNMYTFAPEANFYDPERPGHVLVSDEGLARVTGSEIVLKSCNRCGRFLPVNLANERDHLSFSSHCVAAHRRPCRHTGFGRIYDRDTSGLTELEYGFQLECRFCKKFEVNAAHNPQRTAGQMKEDAARRRHFELLLEHLYGGSPQLHYKNETGRDLALDVFHRFDGRCFKCGTAFASDREMNLDHTRPLALLWPLDETATALCATHNSEKRDRAPADYYTAEELQRLSIITGIPIEQLQDPSPNMEAVALLGQNLDWFANEFLTLPSLQQDRDGKLTADLVVKALRKVLARCPGGPPYRILPSGPRPGAGEQIPVRHCGSLVRQTMALGIRDRLAACVLNVKVRVEQWFNRLRHVQCRCLA